MSDRWKSARARAKNRWNDLSEQQRDLWKIGAGGLVLALVLALGWFAGRPWWQRWQRAQAMAQAQSFAAHSDYRNAALALRRALELAPADPATWREAAAVLAEIGSPEVLLAREQLARLAPGDVAVRLALAGDALRLERWDTAEAALAAIGTAAQRDAAFFRLAASLALALGRTDEVEANLARLVQAAPDDPVARFDDAAVRLWNVDEAKRDAARATLKTLTAQPAVRIRAALELLKDAARQRDERRAVEAMTFVLERFAPGAVADFSSPGLPGWQRLVEALKAAAGSPEDVALLARWFGDLGQPREALVWIDTLAPDLAQSPAVADAAAELAAGVGDLDRLEQRLRAGAWGVWPRDVLTLAIASRLQRLRYTESAGRATWADALAACGDSAPGLRAMVRLASAWGDDDGTERALLQVTERQPRNFWAYAALRDIYAARPDLPKLWQLHDRWVRVAPDDAGLAATWITLGCIVNRLSPEAAARATALHAAEPDARVATIALAAVRWRQGKPRETAALIDRLSAAERAQPAVALWRGLAAADLGDRATARTALLAAWRPGLSPEESGLIRTAAAKARVSLERDEIR